MRPARRLEKALELDPVLFEPAAVRFAARDRGLDFVVVNDAVLRGVDEENLPGREASLFQHLFGRDVEHAHLGRHAPPCRSW